MPFILTQIDLLDITYSEIRQTQKNKYRMSSHRYRLLQEETGGNDAGQMVFLGLAIPDEHVLDAQFTAQRSQLLIVHCTLEIIWT